MSPIAGDPGTIRTWAGTYGGIADTIVAAAGQLQSIELGEQTSLAVVEYRNNAEYLGENIALTEPRYRAVQEALDYYATELEAAQQDERDAIAAAEAADSEHASANTDYLEKFDLATTAATAAAADPTQTGAAEARETSNAAWYRLERARIAQSQAQVDLENASIRAENAGRTAASMITTAVDGDGMNDTWWDDWGKVVYDVLTVIGVVVLVIAAVLAIAALVVATVLTGGLAAVPGIPLAIAIVGGAGLTIGLLQAGMSGAAIASGERGLETQLTWDLIGLIPFSKFAKGPIAALLRNMDVPPTGIGSLSGVPRTTGTNANADDFLDTLGRQGVDQRAAVEYYLTNKVDIFAAISTEAGEAIAAGSPSALPDLAPNDVAPAAHQEPIPIFPLTGDTQRVPVDEYALVPSVPDFDGSYTATDSGGYNGVVRPAPDGAFPFDPFGSVTAPPSYTDLSDLGSDEDGS
ncbi:hypothetical protein KXS11_17385 [Plantibacter flavus]|uniref:hypothetical protein n=1 Tax=Plantibacter flavus TaxID=150123 RepID=UPI003F188E84